MSTSSAVLMHFIQCTNINQFVCAVSLLTMFCLAASLTSARSRLKVDDDAGITTQSPTGPPRDEVAVHIKHYILRRVPLVS